MEESAKSFATYGESITKCPISIRSYSRILVSHESRGESEKFTSAMRLMFSFRSFSKNPRSLFSPNRTLSPSKRYAANPKCRRCCSSAVAIVDFPEADRPVNQIVKPRCFLNPLRSWREREGCQMILLRVVSVLFLVAMWGWRGNFISYVAIYLIN